MISAKDWAMVIAKVVNPNLPEEALRRLEFIVEDILQECMRELGRRGGTKGGLARAKSLSPERRRQIAQLAANARHHPKIIPSVNLLEIRKCNPTNGGCVKTTYAIGIEYSPGSFGMTDGPVPHLKDMLDRIGEERSCLFRFRGKQEEIIYRWVNGTWMKIGKKEIT